MISLSYKKIFYKKIYIYWHVVQLKLPSCYLKEEKLEKQQVYREEESVALVEKNHVKRYCDDTNNKKKLNTLLHPSSCSSPRPKGVTNTRQILHALFLILLYHLLNCSERFTIISTLNFFCYLLKNYLFIFQKYNT